MPQIELGDLEKVSLSYADSILTRLDSNVLIIRHIITPLSIVCKFKIHPTPNHVDPSPNSGYICIIEKAQTDSTDSTRNHSQSRPRTATRFDSVLVPQDRPSQA